MQGGGGSAEPALWAAGRESGGVSLCSAPAHVPDLPPVHHSSLWCDLPPCLARIGSSGSPHRADTLSSFRSLCQSLIPAKELGSGRTMVPIQHCLELDPSRDGPISGSQQWFLLSLLAPGMNAQTSLFLS